MSAKEMQDALTRANEELAVLKAQLKKEAQSSAKSDEKRGSETRLESARRRLSMYSDAKMRLNIVGKIAEESEKTLGGITFLDGLTLKNLAGENFPPMVKPCLAFNTGNMLNPKVKALCLIYRQKW